LAVSDLRRHENQAETKHVESSLVPRLDEGSSPSISTPTKHQAETKHVESSLVPRLDEGSSPSISTPTKHQPLY